MVQNKLTAILNSQLQAELSYSISEDLLQQELAGFIEYLINTDFERLVQILYRTDVSESWLKKILHSKPAENTSIIIAKLIIKRELEKIESRKKYSNRSEADNHERW